MSSPYVGEIRMFGGNFAPAGWAFCQGQSLPISENETLFQLIGTTYGGDGQSNFNLPNLASRFPIHQGQGPGLPSFVLAQAAGEEQVTLTTQQMPTHTHQMLGSTDLGNSSSVANAVPASLPAAGNPLAYGTTVPPGNIDPSSIGGDGGSQPHDNMQPFLCISFIISLFGVFPSQT
jgi:microcystin-dependent protein